VLLPIDQSLYLLYKSSKINNVHRQRLAQSGTRQCSEIWRLQLPKCYACTLHYNVLASNRQEIRGRLVSNALLIYCQWRNNCSIIRVNNRLCEFACASRHSSTVNGTEINRWRPRCARCRRSQRTASGAATGADVGLTHHHRRRRHCLSDVIFIDLRCCKAGVHSPTPSASACHNSFGEVLEKNIADKGLSYSVNTRQAWFLSTRHGTWCGHVLLSRVVDEPYLLIR